MEHIASTSEPESPTTPLSPEEQKLVRRKTATLLVSILLIATNGVIYELLVAGYSSYLLGDSITQFSLTIGLFMSSMGVGSWLTQRFDEKLIQRFIEIEIWLAIIGGPTVLLLAMAHIYTRVYAWVMFGLIIALGILIGFEIPMVTRIVHRYGSLKKALANVLSFDYIGALAGSLLFPLVLLPELGFARTSFVIALVNLAVAVVNIYIFRVELGEARKRLWGVCFITAVGLVAGLLVSTSLIEKARERATGQKVVHLQHSRYQTIRLIQEQQGIGKVLRLFLNSEHQFSSHNEHRYHESLVHPAMSAATSHKRVLVLGGGDGFVLRELWKYKGIKELVLVDLDPAMTKFARSHKSMQKLHGGGIFADKRLTVVHDDAFLFLQRQKRKFDVAILDLPVPTNISLSKLYTRTFYRQLRQVLAKGGVAMTEAATLNPLEQKPFWSLVRTQKAAGWTVTPYLDGTMAYTLMSHKPLKPKTLALGVPTRHLTTTLMRSSFHLPADAKPQWDAPINTLETHALLGLVLALR
jgi:spermidine synthase